MNEIRGQNLKKSRTLLRTASCLPLRTLMHIGVSFCTRTAIQHTEGARNTNRCDFNVVAQAQYFNFRYILVGIVSCSHFCSHAFNHFCLDTEYWAQCTHSVFNILLICLKAEIFASCWVQFFTTAFWIKWPIMENRTQIDHNSFAFIMFHWNQWMWTLLFPWLGWSNMNRCKDSIHFIPIPSINSEYKFNILLLRQKKPIPTQGMLVDVMWIYFWEFKKNWEWYDPNNGTILYSQLYTLHSAKKNGFQWV